MWEYGTDQDCSQFRHYRQAACRPHVCIRRNVHHLLALSFASVGQCVSNTLDVYELTGAKETAKASCHFLLFQSHGKRAEGKTWCAYPSLWLTE